MPTAWSVPSDEWLSSVSGSAGGQDWAYPYQRYYFAIKFKDFFRERNGADRSKIRRDFGGHHRADQERRGAHRRVQGRRTSARCRGFGNEWRNRQAHLARQGGP